MFHTVFFVLGVSFAFFLLGLGFSAMGNFLKENQIWFARIGGVIVILFGLYQMGFLGKSYFLGKERRLPFKMDLLAMSPVTALVMGFTFSFAWTPCVGPALASVLLMTASAATKVTGFLYIAVYTAGFVLPFLAVGLFTTTLLEFFKSHMKVVHYTVKIGGILMIFMGILMLTGKMNAVSGALSSTETQEEATESHMKVVHYTVKIGGILMIFMGILMLTGKMNAVSGALSSTETQEEATEAESEVVHYTVKIGGILMIFMGILMLTGKMNAVSGALSSTETQEEATEAESEEEEEAAEEVKTIPAIDFTLKDQYGNTHTLSDYKGKTVFLNFWATWCSPCRAEMPDIQKLYEEFQQEEEDIVILGVAAPNLGREKSEEGIKGFLEENGYTYPVLMDTEAEAFQAYGINSFPTTFMIDKDGNVFGYIPGQLSEETMRDIIRQTVDGNRK